MLPEYADRQWSTPARSPLWARSGAAGLSGREDGPALPVPQALVDGIVAAGRRVAAASGALGREVLIDALALLGERAALSDLTRHGDVSCGGATQLMPTRDGWIAVSLARADDVDLVPAWLDVSPLPTDLAELWSVIRAIVAAQTSAPLVERSALLGLACSAVGEEVAGQPAVLLERGGDTAPARHADDLLVVDLSALWAGPLCAQLLGAAGARVVKIESTTRPDGARGGSPAFYDLLNAHHESVALDFSDPVGLARLRALVQRADVVIEASRARALTRLGVRDLARAPDGPKVWVSITGHGPHAADGAGRVAFGDDAAAAGGLVTRDGNGFCFCCDAVADPASGLMAAAAALEAVSADGRWLIDVAMSRVAASLSHGPLVSPGDGSDIARPHARPVTAAAPSLGAHTEAVLGELCIGG